MKEIFISEGYLYDKSNKFTKIKDVYNKLNNTIQYNNETEKYKAMWSIFITDIIIVSENLPQIDFNNENVLKMFKNNVIWDFSKIYPNFKFATFSNAINNPILSMNPMYFNSDNYFGTLSEFKAKYNELPTQCTFIANNMTPVQQLELINISKEIIISFDVNDTKHVELKYNWDIGIC